MDWAWFRLPCVQINEDIQKQKKAKNDRACVWFRALWKIKKKRNRTRGNMEDGGKDSEDSDKDKESGTS